MPVISLSSAESQEDYQLLLKFNNGEEKILDMKPYIEKGVFQELKNVSYFSQVKAHPSFVCWPHDQDLSLDTLYLRSAPVTEQSRNNF